jgi:hypothetical protein
MADGIGENVAGDGEGERQNCWRLSRSRADSSHQNEEEEKARLPVPLARRGRLCSGGAMAKERQMLSVVEEKGKRKRVLAARGRRWVRARVWMRAGEGLKGRGSRWHGGGEDHGNLLTPCACSRGRRRQRRWRRTASTWAGLGQAKVAGGARLLAAAQLGGGRRLDLVLGLAGSG